MDKFKEEYTIIKTQLDSAKQQIEIKNQKIEKIELDNRNLQQKIGEMKEKHAHADELLKDAEQLK